MFAALPSRRTLALLSLAAFVLVSVLFVVYERKGLGLGHFYYVAIALAALAGGTQVGVGAGLLAAGLFQLGVAVNPHLETSGTLPFGTPVRASTFVAIGALVGWFANRHREMIGELQLLADRDVVTGLPNTRVFEAAIGRRLDVAHPFALLIGELAGSDDFAGQPDELLRPLADQLLSALGPGDEIARVGATEFAILAGRQTRTAGRLAARLEATVGPRAGRLTFGWASFPEDGDNALALYRAASERLYARSVVHELDARRREAAAKTA